MNSKTRKRIWPVALMPLAILGVVAVVVALSAMAPQTTTAQTAAADCAAITDPIERAQCQTCQSGGDIWNPTTQICDKPTTTPGTPTTPGGTGGTAIAVDVEAPGAVRNLTVVTNENGTPQEELSISWEAPNTDTGAR